MFCDQCGAKVSEKSKFCSSCGNQLKKSNTTSNQNRETEWQYKTFKWDFPDDVKPKRVNGLQSEHDVKMSFWSEHQNEIMPELNNHLDKGWKTINDIGANCIETKEIKTEINKQFELHDLVGTIATSGLWLIWYFMQKADDPIAIITTLKPNKFKIKLRKLQ